MKKLLFILLPFISVCAIGQPVVNRSSSVVTVQDGRIKGLYNMVVPVYQDTTAANSTSSPNAIGVDSSGAIIHTFSPDAFWYRQSFPKKWVQILSSGSSGIYMDSVYSSPATKTDTLIGTKNGASFYVQVTDRNCGLIDPGTVTYDSLLIYTISPSVYILCSDGIRRTSVNTDVTLAAADPTFDRRDAIILDATGVTVLSGTPSATPADPQINPDQILLTYITVPATATSIPPCSNPDYTVWDENTGTPEATVSGTVTNNANNTTNPYHLTKAVDVGSFTNGQTLIFTPPSNITVRSYTSLKFFIRLKSNFGNNTSFQVSFVTSSGSVTVNILNGTYGFSRTTTGSYQAITIPISDFNTMNTAVSLALSIPAAVSLKFTMIGSNANGFYLDYIQLGGSCITQPTPQTFKEVDPLSIHNQSFQQPGSNFNISGDGTVGNRFVIGTTTDSSGTPIPQRFNLMYNSAATSGTVLASMFRTNYTAAGTQAPQGVESYMKLSGGSKGSALGIISNIETSGSTGTFDRVAAYQSGIVPFTTGTTTITEAVNYRSSAIQGNGSTTGVTVTNAYQFYADSFRTAGITYDNKYSYYALQGAGIGYFYDGATIGGGRFQEKQGSSVSAANNLTLGSGGNTFSITGATQINAITTSGWQAGSSISLIFASTPTVKHNTAGGAGTAPLLLSGSVDFTAAANSVLNLVYNGSNWIEKSRQVSSTGGGVSITADNGLTANTSSNVQLFGTVGTPATLLNSRYLDATASYFLNITGAITPTAIFRVTNTSTFGGAIIGTSDVGIAIAGASTGGYGVRGTSTGGPGVSGQSSSASGVEGVSITGYAGYFQLNPTASTNSAVGVLQITRTVTGTAASGIGSYIEYTNPTTTDTRISNQLKSIWTTATDATRTSQFIITGVNNAVTADKFTLSGSGALKLNAYGSGTFTGTPTYTLQVDASGNIIEGSAGISSITADNGLTANTATNVQLGGSALLFNTSILTSAFSLTIPSSNSSATLNVSNSSSGVGLYGTNTSNGTAISGEATSTGNGVQGVAVSGTAIEGVSSSGLAGNFRIAPSSTNTVAEILRVIRLSSGTGANGIGGSINFYNEATGSGSGGRLSNELISKWTDATDASRTSQFIITGVNSATTYNLTKFDGNGAVTMDGLGSPSVTLTVNNAGSGAGVVATTTGDAAVVGNSSGSTGVAGISSSSFAVTGLTTTGVAAFFQVNPSSTSTVVPVLQLNRTSSGTAAAGLGGSIDFQLKTTGGGSTTSNVLVSKWTDPTNGSQTSQFIIKGIFSAASVDVLTLNGESSIILNGISATAASAITPAEGMIVRVTTTNGTFTSVGYWAYENSTWVKW